MNVKVKNLSRRSVIIKTLVSQREIVKFLADRPPKEDELQTHRPLAQTLIKHVENSTEGSFVIGLFGDWGTGKTAIIRWFKEYAQKNSDIAYAELDAWQAGENYFGVSFVRAIVDQCVWKKSDRDRILNKIATRVISRRTSPELANARLLITILVTVFATLIYLLVNLYIFVDRDFPWVSLATFILTGGVALLIQFYANNLAIKSEISEEDVSVEQADRFQEILINDVFPAISQPICCIVVDNIDRLEPKEALEVIRKLKTYVIDEKKLEKEGKQFVIVVPCDDRLLVRHVQDLHGKKNQNLLDKNSQDEESGRQFIRKFFNIAIRIPQPLRQDLYRFTETLVRRAYGETKVPSNIEDIVFIINRAANRNPRDVVNAINEFVSLYFLLEVKKKDAVPLEISKNPHWIAFYACLGFVGGYADFHKTVKDLREKPNQPGGPTSVFVSSTENLWEGISEEAWQWFRHHKVSDNLLNFPGFNEIYDNFIAKDPKEAWASLQEWKVTNIPGLMNALIVESPSDRNALSNICETALRMLPLGLDVNDLPYQLIDRTGSLLRSNVEGASTLICGPLTLILDRLSKTGVEAAIEIARIQAKAASEVEAGKTGIDPKPDWLVFFEKYISLLIKGSKTYPKLPTSALSICITFSPEIAKQVVENPSLIQSGQAASAIGERLKTDELFFPKEAANGFLKGIEEFLKDFYSVFLPSFTLKVQAPAPASIEDVIYEIATEAASSESDFGPTGQAEISSMLDQMAGHISARQTNKEKLLPMLVVDAIKSKNADEVIVSKCTAIQNQLGAEVYQHADHSYLLKYVREFPKAFETLPQDHLVEIGKLNDQLWNAVLDLARNDQDFIYKRLLGFSPLNALQRIRNKRRAQDKTSFVSGILGMAEEGGFQVTLYDPLKSLRGQFTKAMKEQIYQHYSKFVAARDFSDLNRLSELGLIVSLLGVKLKKDQKQELEKKLQAATLAVPEAAADAFRQEIDSKLKLV